MSSSPFIAGVLAKIEELFDVAVPDLQIDTACSLALPPLVNRDRRVVGDFQEGDDTLAAAVGPLDVAPKCPDVGPVVTDPPTPLGEQRVVSARDRR
jgi:hypothetical protein